MARIELNGKYAVGDRRFALVDDEDLPRLRQYSWHVRVSRNTAYAVRGEFSRVDGKKKNGQVAMHREVLRLTATDPGETDHINHNGLDNRKVNLRVVSTSENQRNRLRRVADSVCESCGKPFTYEGRIGKQRLYCSRRCRGFAPDSLLTESGRQKAEKLLDALVTRMGTRGIASQADLHIVSVWRLLPQLIKQGSVSLVNKNPHLYERRQ